MPGRENFHKDFFDIMPCLIVAVSNALMILATLARLQRLRQRSTLLAPMTMEFLKPKTSISARFHYSRWVGLDLT